MFIALEVYISFYNTPNQFEVAGYLRRVDSVFAKDSSATSGLLWSWSLMTLSLSILICFVINTGINLNTYLKYFHHSLVEFGTFL